MKKTSLVFQSFFSFIPHPSSLRKLPQMKYSSMKLKIVGTNLQSVLLFTTILAALFLNGCGGKAETKSKTAESDVRPAETVRVRENVATFLGNPSRSFYGTGPWGTQPL